MWMHELDGIRSVGGLRETREKTTEVNVMDAGENMAIEWYNSTCALLDVSPGMCWAMWCLLYSDDSAPQSAEKGVGGIMIPAVYDLVGTACIVMISLWAALRHSLCKRLSYISYFTGCWKNQKMNYMASFCTGTAGSVFITCLYLSSRLRQLRAILLDDIPSPITAKNIADHFFFRGITEHPTVFNELACYFLPGLFCIDWSYRYPFSFPLNSW